MRTVEKVTISLPGDLFEFIEQQRARSGSSRSETVASLLRQAQQVRELKAREEQYAAAYARQPETDEERAFGDDAFEELMAGSEWEDDAPSRNNRAAG